MDYKSDVEPSDTSVEAVNKIINARQSGDVVILVGDCTINYDGRAWSYAEGRHSVIINPSGSVVIHHSNSVKAKNWQPKGAETTVDINEDNEVVVQSVRTNPEEELNVRFTNLMKSVHYEPSGEDINLKGSEKEIHEYIYDNASVIDDHFVPEEMEKNIKTGDIDIFGHIGERVAIVEVKRKKAQQEDVGQLRRYMDMFENATGFLVAPSITQPAEDVLVEEYGFNYVQLSPSVVFDD